MRHLGLALVSLAVIVLAVVVVDATEVDVAAQEATATRGERPTRSDGTQIYRDREFRLVPNGWVRAGRSLAELQRGAVYFSIDRGSSWQAANVALEVPADESRTPYFNFKANRDGLYWFKFVLPGDTVPVTGGSPDLFMWIDTTPPSVEPISPVEGSAFAKGVEVPIRFKTYDENPETNGLSVEYTTDGGANWNVVASDAPINQELSWKHPFEEPTSVDVRFSVRDRVNNIQPVVVRGVTLGGAGVRKVADKPSITVSGPNKDDTIYFETTDFFYTTENYTGSPLKYVAIWYTMDGGATWKAGGDDKEPQEEGKVSVRFPDGFKRNDGYFGNYTSIGFYYQVVNEVGQSNKPDPVNGSSQPEVSYNVDVISPKLYMTSPSRGDKLYKGKTEGNNNSGTITIKWGGADRNLVEFTTRRGHESGPVSIWYSSKPVPGKNDWTLLSTNLPIDYTLTKVLDWPAATYRVKLVARDQMGNTTTRISGQFDVLGGASPNKPAVTGTAVNEVDRLWGIALQYYNAGDYAKAVRYYNSALEVAIPQKSAIRHDRALAFYKMGSVRKAKDELKALVAETPLNHTYRYALASIQYSTGESGLAQEQLESVAKNDSSEPHIKARHLLAKIYIDKGMRPQAIELWKSIVKNGSKISSEYADAEANLKRYGGQAAETPAEEESGESES